MYREFISDYIVASRGLVSLIQKCDFEALEKLPKLDDVPCIIGITAAKLGNLDVLLWLHEQKRIDLNEQTTTQNKAAEYGHLHIIKGLHEKGFPIDDATLIIAALHGHLDILKFLHSIGTKFDYNTFDAAAYGNYTEIMDYLQDLL